MDADAGHRKCCGTYPPYRNDEMSIPTVAKFVRGPYSRRNRLIWALVAGFGPDVWKYLPRRFRCALGR